MSYLALVRKNLPGPIRAAYRRALPTLRKISFLPERAANHLATRVISPGIQRNIPLLRARLKISPTTQVALVVSSGNRLHYLKRSLPTYLNQDYKNYQVVLSVYADEQGTAEYVRERFPDAIRDRKLMLLETPASRFNKALAVNIAAQNCSGEFLFLVDCDCYLKDSRTLHRITRQFNLLRPEVASFSYWGQILVRRDRFIQIGGYDTTLNDGWAPDDFDFISRYVALFRCSYKFLAPTYSFCIEPHGDQFRIIQRDARWEVWVVHDRKRDPGFDVRNFADTKFYRRIGGLKKSKIDYFDATIKFFLSHDPQLRFVREPKAVEQLSGCGVPP